MAMFYENLDISIKTAHGFIEFLWRIYWSKPFGDISFGSISRHSNLVFAQGGPAIKHGNIFYENFRFRHQVVHGFIEFFYGASNGRKPFGDISFGSIRIIETGFS